MQTSNCFESHVLLYVAHYLSWNKYTSEMIIVSVSLVPDIVSMVLYEGSLLIGCPIVSNYYTFAKYHFG